MKKQKKQEETTCYCKPPNITYCKKEIYPEFDCSKCVWVVKNHNLKLREKAKKILKEHMSVNTLKHIEKIKYLEDWIVDAMIEFKETE